MSKRGSNKTKLYIRSYRRLPVFCTNLKPTLNHCGIQGSCRDSRHQENKNMMTQDELDVWVNELLEQNNDS